MQAQENAKKSNKKFGAFGPQSFQSRSLQAFQKELEAGKASHLMPVFNAKEQVKQGKIKDEDVPYMQRGGSWDNSDLKTAKKLQWNEDDKKYQARGQQNQKPFWAATDWSGTGSRGGPVANNKKPAQQQKPKVQKLFGLF